MQPPPNRTLIALVLTVLAIFLVGVLFSIGSINELIQKEFPGTGYFSSDVGNITINIVDTLSITTEDSSIVDFGGCSANGTIYSNETDGNNMSQCSGYTPGSIIIRNDGNTMANVTFNTTDWGEADGGTFLNSTTDNSWIAYKVANTTTNGNYSGGCNAFFQSNWTNITDGSQKRACDNLGVDSVSNSFSFDIAIYIPATTKNGNNNISIDFLAKVAT